ncbi:MAG: cyanophycinase [Gemmatimonadaceae bacterium]|nr:cyanophycinase [Gemmatimonadaceae bacterium]
MKWRLALVLALAVAVAPPARMLGAQGDGAPRGALFIVGGGPQPQALVEEFVRLAGGAGRARVVVFAMASASGQSSGEEKARALRAMGVDAENIWIDRGGADDSAVVRRVRQATGIWFGGGDQSRLTAALAGSATAQAIAERYREGAVVGGTSAGAAVMSAVMITGEERHPGGVRPDTALAFGVLMRDNVVTADGFSLISNAIIDQHFVRRRRHNRLISLVLERAPHLGVGIDESTALVVEAGGGWRVLGESVAVIYDARRAEVTAGGTLGASGVTMHVLPSGSRFEPGTGRAHLAPRR